MSPENEPLRRVPTPAAELEAEREVDFGRYARELVRRWWLLALGAVAGAVVGLLLGQSDDSTFQAQAIIFPGQPLSSGGNATLTSLTSDPASVAAIARSQALVDEVASEVGISPQELRRSISTSMLGERSRTQQVTIPLIGLTVRGEDRQQVERAANLLADAVVEEVSGYPDAKIANLDARVEAQRDRLASIEETIDRTTASVATGGLSAETRLALSNLLLVLEQQRADVSEDLLATEQLLAQATEAERGRVVTEASAARVDARNTRTSIVVGAFIGLVLGALAALLWAPVGRLRAD